MNAEQAHVSVVIPCYKCRDTIERAILSVIQQTLIPLQIILVEDVSDDGTFEFLQEMKVKYGSLVEINVIVSEKNQGAGSARNLGLKSAIGNYIAFLDADDSWHPFKIEIQYSWMVKHPYVEVTGHDRLVVDDESYEPLIINKSAEVNKISANSMLFKTPFSTPTVMMKNNAKYRFPPIRYAEDYGLWLDIVLSGGKCYKIDSPLALIYKAAYGSGGLSSHLLQMELGVQSAFKDVLKKSKISLPMYLTVSLFSWLKFLRRLLLSKISK